MVSRVVLCCFFVFKDTNHVKDGQKFRRKQLLQSKNSFVNVAGQECNIVYKQIEEEIFLVFLFILKFFSFLVRA